MSIKAFGRIPDGREVQRITLKKDELKANILTYGGVLQDLRLAGHNPALVLGFEDLDQYLRHSPYFGSNVGRCANRIRGGLVRLEGKDYQLDQNFLARHHLHGGSLNTGNRVWEIFDKTDDSLTLSIHLLDGEMGYPGNAKILLSYRLLNEGVLDIRFSATTDKTTLCNFAHHSYFNLDGSASIASHLLQVDADSYLPTDEDLIPTGEVASLAGTDFDFQHAKSIGTVSKPRTLDHNFCLSNNAVKFRKVACLFSPLSGIAMDIHTTEPGLQVYAGAKIIIPVPGLDGMRMGPCAGIALEPQIWPDAIHHSEFPQAILRPGEVYRQQTQFKFSKDKE